MFFSSWGKTSSKKRWGWGRSVLPICEKPKLNKTNVVIMAVFFND
jgi:hypothetical protein